MAEYRPLSTRGNASERFDGPTDGYPQWLWKATLDWLSDRMHVQGDPEHYLTVLQNALRMEEPLPWSQSGWRGAWSSLRTRMVNNPDFALDVLDFALHLTGPGAAAALNDILALGGSAWEVVEVDEHYALGKRAVGPVGESIDSIGTHSQRAHHHLMTAWAKLMGRNPDASAAYREAIKAVEAVAKPVVTPNDQLATLGKIIRAIRDKPEKFEVVLDKAAPEQVADMADLIWKAQADRHGSDDESVPLAVTVDEADAAVHIAIPLVRLFAGGGFRRVT